MNSKKELAQEFKKTLKILPNTTLIYCKNKENKKTLLNCQKNNYLKNSKQFVCQKQVTEK